MNGDSAFAARGPDRYFQGFTLLETLIVIVVMAVIATVVIVRLPDFALSNTKLKLSVARQFEAASDHATLTARPVEVHVRARGLAFSEFRTGRWSGIRGLGVSLGTAERLVMASVAGGRVIPATQRLRVDDLGRWPPVEIELYEGSRQVWTMRIDSARP